METFPMLKVALVAATVLVAASAAQAANIDPDSGATPASAVPCHPVQTMDLDCALRVVDANGDGTISPAELTSFATPAPPLVDWAPLHPPRSTGIDFKDAATEPVATLPATLDSDNSRRLIPALFALGALVLLLRRRPT
jgi:hypothetical protein